MNSLYKPNKKGVDTRKRRRLFKVLRRVERISLVILAWIAGATILYGIYNYAFVKPYFLVNEVEVRGDFHSLSEREIIEISGIKMGDHLFRIPVGEIQEGLIKNPWVKEAAVHRKLPHMVWIYVKEYLPEVMVRVDGWHYVDRFGNMFKKLDLDDERDFPVITGLESKIEDDAFKSRLLELLSVKKIYESSRLDEIYGLSEIHFDKNRGVSIITLNDPMELRLGFGPFKEKIVRIETVYPAIRSHGGIVAYIDLSPDGKVVVKYGT